jgi:hypothetical protein
MRGVPTTLGFGLVAGVLGLALVADAATVRVRCETRSNPPRSKASVDGNDLVPGVYSARLISGANVATSAPQQSVGDEAEFDFDSNRPRGGTLIAADFIQNDQVTGQILDAGGAVVVEGSATCRAR